MLDAIDKVSASLIDGAPSIDYKRGYDVAVRHIAAGVRKLDPVVMQDPEPVQPNPTPKASKSEPDDVWTLHDMRPRGLPANRAGICIRDVQRPHV